MEITILVMILGGFAFLFLISGVRIINQTERGLIETFGKYSYFAEPGFQWVVPIVQRAVQVDVTEQMEEIDTQEIITEDNLNANVDLVVYYKVKNDEENVKKSVYNVSDFRPQIVRLAQTTARNVIGTMMFKDVNSKRNDLNVKLAEILKNESANWGVAIVRVELKDITPPKEVQETMNSVIQAENTKRAAIDFATAEETKADGFKRAKIKEAEGIAKNIQIIADANAFKIKVENEAAQKYFKAEAKELKRLEVTQASLQNNAKIIITKDGINPQLIIGNLPVSN